MPVVLPRPEYQRLLERAERTELAEADRDRWERTADNAVATAKTVAKAVDSAMCALAIVHDMDAEGVCSCGHVSPCPTGEALRELWPYWANAPAKLDAILGRPPRAA